MHDNRWYRKERSTTGYHLQSLPGFKMDPVATLKSPLAFEDFLFHAPSAKQISLKFQRQ